MRRRCGFAALLASAVLALTPAPALSLTRREAVKRALHVLAPQRLRGQYVAVFGLNRPLRAGQRVFEGAPGPRGAGRPRADGAIVERIPPLTRQTWLFWEDQAYFDDFKHPSVLLLIDAKTGKVTRRQTLQYWPVIDTRPPPFITNRGPGDRRYRIFMRLRPPVPDLSQPFHRPAGEQAAAAAQWWWPAAPWPARASANQLSPSDVANDCLIIMADEREVAFTHDRQEMRAFFEARGMPVYGNAAAFGKNQIPTRHANGSAPDGQDLVAFVKRIRDRCKDIIIYLAGHGSGDHVGVGEQVIQNTKTGKTEVYGSEVYPEHLEEITKGNPDNTFAVIVQSCHSGKWRKTMEQHGATGNVQVMAYSAREEETSQSWSISWFTAGLIEGMREVEPAVAADTTGRDKAKLLIGMGAQESTDKEKDWSQWIGHTHLKGELLLNYRTPPPPTPPRPDPPQIYADPIKAVFTQSTFSTEYSINAARGTFPTQDNQQTETQQLTYQWSVSIPDDPNCAKGFKPNSPDPNKATWVHSDTTEGGFCDHSKYAASGSGHPGTVTVVVSNSAWQCTATYYGTQGADGSPSGTGPAAQCARK